MRSRVCRKGKQYKAKESEGHEDDNMARSVMSRAVVVREKFYWPDAQLNFWTIMMLATAGTLIGINAMFITIQQRFRVGIPW